MPLVGMLDGERVVAPLTGDELWQQMKAGATVTLPCDARAVPKQSKYGTRFFAHWPGSHCDVEHRPESAEHLRAKELILLGAHAAGWDATPEVPAPDGAWIADVLASSGTSRVALEVQWSQQTPEEYHARTARYLADGIDCYWFARHEKSLGGYDFHLPVFGLRGDGGDFTTLPGSNTRWFDDHGTGLEETVTNLLGEYPRRWRPLAESEQGFVVEWIWMNCYRCSGWSRIWRVPDERAFRCGDCGRSGTRFGHRGGISFLDPLDHVNVFPADPPIEMHADVLRIIGQLDKLATITKRFTKTSGVQHYGFTCPHCRAVLGNMFIRNDRGHTWKEDQRLMGPASDRVQTPLELGGHWCKPSS
ncbi:competence protein CoiA [Agromyces sp. Soil535]|uniref:competence protein CoiA n=1 Tax=Agromyces sp. Soil535 TaxID=1736390 RepID=UPI0006FDB9A4|nr:competence protein CoiA family protein [Agromyces sp. Soil535]KRE28269.1 hypothetical protein ASG80_21565 [Agromyces sp. Soil535]